MAKLTKRFKALQATVVAGKSYPLEEALKLLQANANAKFEHRFAAMEKILKDQGITLEAATSDQMETAWERVKEVMGQ